MYDDIHWSLRHWIYLWLEIDSNVGFNVTSDGIIWRNYGNGMKNCNSFMVYSLGCSNFRVGRGAVADWKN